MTKIRALKDSPLAKQGEVFEGEETGHFNIGGFYSSRLSVDKWISDGWFSVVEERKLSLKEKYIRIVDSLYTIDPLISTAREHAIEIVREADGEYNSARMMTGKAQYIIQKLDERMR